MSGHPRVIGYLQRAINHEFSAATQYTLQAARAESLGLRQFATELREGIAEETRHAEVFISCMYALGIEPHAGQPRAPRIGRTYAEMLRYGMDTEGEAIKLYDEAARYCARIGDEAHREVFARICKDEVDHYQHLQKQLEASGLKRA